MPLIDFWETNRANLLAMEITQIVQMAGNGKLTDGSECSKELRDFLKKVDVTQLERYAASCLDKGFELSGFVLQDIVNEVGRRLGCAVSNGLYRGRKGQIGADGLWKFEDWGFVVEVKTTDAYTIRLDKIEEYRAASCAEGALAEPRSSSIIVVGREDTNTLEDQVRGSRYNWRIRIVGVEALFNALKLKEETAETALTGRIIDILKPREFTRVDSILDIAFQFTRDREQVLQEEESTISPSFEMPEGETLPDGPSKTHSQVTNRQANEVLRQNVANALAAKLGVEVSRSRASYESADGDTRFVVAVSKPYERRDRYWFGCHEKQLNFIEGCYSGYFALCLLDTEEAFSIPAAVMRKYTKNMLTTPPRPKQDYYHVAIRKEYESNYIFIHPTQELINIDEYKIF